MTTARDRPDGGREQASPLRRRPRRRRLGMAAVAVVAAGVLVVPSMVGRGDAAFASWTPVAVPLRGAEAQDAARSCRDELSEPAAGDARLSVADRRGAWTTVLLTGNDGWSALCVTDASAGWFSRDTIGSSGTITDWREPGPRDLVATDLGVGATSAREISLLAGFAGSDVAAVTLPTATAGDVGATVHDGRFALWLPGDGLASAEQSHHVDVRVSYSDGTTEDVTVTS